MSCSKASASLGRLAARTRPLASRTTLSFLPQPSSSSAPVCALTTNVPSRSISSSTATRQRAITPSLVLRSGPRPATSSSPSPSDILARNGPLGSTLSPNDILSFFAKEPFPAPNLLGNDAELATRAMTHESYMLGREGHNRRLAFLGRRSLKMFTTLFLHSSLNASSLESTSWDYISNLLESPAHVDDILHTSKIGDSIGRQLGLEKVMRWTPAVTDGQLGPKETGLFKIRGVCLEALVGAVYHHAGAEKASNFFHAYILPTLVQETFPSGVPSEIAERASQLSQSAKSALS